MKIEYNHTDPVESFVGKVILFERNNGSSTYYYVYSFDMVKVYPSDTPLLRTKWLNANRSAKGYPIAYAPNSSRKSYLIDVTDLPEEYLPLLPLKVQLKAKRNEAT